MKIILFIIVILNLVLSNSLADEKKDCSAHKKLIEKMKCKASGVVKPGSFLKNTIDKTVDYQKKLLKKKTNSINELQRKFRKTEYKFT